MPEPASKPDARERVAPAWHRRHVPFKFKLSDLTLMSVSLPLKCRSVGLLEPFVPLDALRLADEIDASDIDGLQVRALPIDGDLPTVSRRDGYLVYAPLTYQHCHIDLTMGFAAYQQKFSSKSRSTIHRKVRKYAEHCGGAIPWRSFQAPGEMREFVSLARAVSVLTYQERLLDAGLPDGEDFVQRTESLAAEGRVRAYILFDGDRPVSYLYCPVNDGVVIYAYLGYAPEYRTLSVGTVLQWLALERLFEESGLKAFDFTEGQSDHKRLFATHHQRRANLFVLRNTTKNRLVVAAHCRMNRISAWLGRKMDSMGIRAKVKRLLRSAAY